MIISSTFLRNASFTIGISFVIASIFFLLSPPEASASLSCHEEVVKIEVLYSLPEQSTVAQIHLKNGLAVMWSAKTDKDERMLYQMVSYFSNLDIGLKRSVLFVTIQEDEIISFKIVIANNPRLCC